MLTANNRERTVCASRTRSEKWNCSARPTL